MPCTVFKKKLPSVTLAVLINKDVIGGLLY